MRYLCSVARARGESSTAMNTTVKVSSRQQLVAERLRRRWTQQEVADQLGTTAGNVSRWERGLTSPGPYFRRKLCELFGRSAQELGLTWDGSKEALSPHTRVSALAASFQRDTSAASYPFPTGREELLALLYTLMRPDAAASSSVSASSRPGELSLPEQENGEQGRLAQGLQTGTNWVLLPNNAEVI